MACAKSYIFGQLLGPSQKQVKRDITELCDNTSEWFRGVRLVVARPEDKLAAQLLAAPAGVLRSPPAPPAQRSDSKSNEMPASPQGGEGSGGDRRGGESKPAP